MIKTEAYNESKQFLGLTKKNGVKASKLYTQKPLGFFSVTRNLAAYRTNQEGVLELMGANVPRIDYPITILEPERTNLILYSQEFNNAAWAKTNVTVTANTAIAPDGTMTADSAVSNSGSLYSALTQNRAVSQNSTFTFSIYIKKETTQTGFGGLSIAYTGTSTKVCYVIFNPITGTYNVASSNITPIVNVFNIGNYWRVSVTATDNGNNTNIYAEYYAYLSTNGTTLSPGLGSQRTIWGAQLEIGNTATAYIPTTNAPVTVPAVIEAQCPELLVENEATNRLLHSEDFSNAIWTKGNVTVTSNNTNAPNESLTADLITPNVGNFFKYLYQNTAIINNGIFQSFYVKSNTAQFVQILFSGIGQYANFDLINKTFIAYNGAIGYLEECYNGFLRIGIYSNNPSNTDGPFICFVDSLTSARASSTTTTNTIWLWGSQLETSTNGKATSYIPTTTATVTRPADNVRNNTIGYDNEESTIFVRARLNFTTDYQGIATLWDGDDIYNGYITMYYYISGGVRYIAFDTYNGSDTNQYLYTAPSDGVYSIAFAYNTTSGGYKIAINGVLITDDAFPNDLPSYTLLTQTTLGSFLTYFNSRTKGFMYFDTMLGNDSLENLTVQ